jgi:PAS domain S-box-containing protein
LHGLIWAKYIPYLQNGLAFSNKTYGPGFWIYWSYSYLLLLAATVLTIRLVLASPRIFRWQSLLVTLGILAPWVANLLYILHVDPIRNLDLTSLAFGITAIALAFGMFRWQLFDIKPIAQAAVITGMADGLMILDNQGRILQANPAAQAILGLGVQELVGKPMEETIANRLAPEERSRWLSEKGMEIRLTVGSEGRDFELSDSPFYEKAGSSGGKIIFLHDVTERKRLEERVRESERKQAEQALRLSEDKFKYVFDYSVDGKSLTNLSGGMEVNQALCDMLGYSRQELINRTWQEISHPEDLELTQKMIDVLLSGEEERVHFTKRLIHKNGSIIWTDIGSALRKDQDGQPLYLVTSVTDVTERKQAEAALQESEVKFRQTFELSPIGMVMVGMDRRFLRCNPAFAKSLGYATEELVGKTIQDITCPEDADIGMDEMAAILKGEIESAHVQKRYICKDGRLIWAEVTIALVSDSAGQPQYFLAIIQDVSQRIMMEQTLINAAGEWQATFDAANDAIWLLDPDQRVVRSNKTAERMFHRPYSEFIGMHCWEIVHGGLEPIPDCPFARARNSLHRETMELQLGQGWFNVSVDPILDSQGRYAGAVHIASDISDRKKAQQAVQDYNARLEVDVAERTRELQEAQEKLVRQEKLAILGQMAGSVGHELRNPLSVINNAVYYLKQIQPDADEKVRKYHCMIEHELHNAEKIIADLLEFARIKSVDREPLALPDLVQRVLERFPVPESLTTVLDFPADLPQVYVDPRQMEQVLGNLAVNACQAMSEGGELAIRARPSTLSDGQPAVSIQVQDTGSGITPENMKKLFEPLFTTKPKGIGLGLVVSRKLVEANGGRIEVQSEPGRGTTFTVYLPVK